MLVCWPVMCLRCLEAIHGLCHRGVGVVVVVVEHHVAVWCRWGERRSAPCAVLGPVVPALSDVAVIRLGDWKSVLWHAGDHIEQVLRLLSGCLV